MVKILDVGSGSIEQCVAAVRFPDAEITRVDANPDNEPDVVADIRELPEELHGVFDGVIASHVLEHVPWQKALVALNECVACLKPGGLMFVVVPDLEWACREIVLGRAPVAIVPFLFGGQGNQWSFHQNGFTISMMRELFMAAGLAVRQTKRELFRIVMSNAGEFEVPQFLMIGEKS